MEKSLYNFVNRRAYNENFDNELVIREYSKTNNMHLREKVILNILKFVQTELEFKKYLTRKHYNSALKKTKALVNKLS